MAQYIPETVPIGGPVAPIGPDEIYATHWAYWAKGGYRTVDNLLGRDTIPTKRREPGMIAYIREDRSTWRLNDDLITWEYLGYGCCILLEWSILDVDEVSVSDVDGILLLEPGEEDYPFVYRHGDTMTGPLILSRDPVIGVDPPLMAVGYQWVLDQLGQFEGEKVLIHHQITPVTSFVLPHDFERLPVVSLLDSSGRQMQAQVIPTTTQVRFDFQGTMTFTAILK